MKAPDSHKTPAPEIPEAISIQGLSQAWQVNEDTLRRMARCGTLPSFKLGKKVMIRLDQLRERIEA